MPVVEEQQQQQQQQASDNNTGNNTRRVSFAPEIVDQREEPERVFDDEQRFSGVSTTTSATTATSINPNDGTGMRFKIDFQENRLRFDQTFPEKLDMRVSQSEFEIVLEQIHREFSEPLDKSQKSVRSWSVLVGATAPIVLGFLLSPVLARRVSRHQKALKNFWLALRNHLKTINREVFYARGIEWRIERDIEKITEREAYNKLYCFRMEIVFRKPVSGRSSGEAALRSLIEPSPRSSEIARASLAPSTTNSTNRFSDLHLADPELFALMATAPGGEEYDLGTQETSVDDGFGVDAFVNGPIAEEPEDEIAGNAANDTSEDASALASPFFVQDQSVEPEPAFDPENEDHINSLLVRVEEPEEVTRARVSSTFEPPSPSPETSVFTVPDEQQTSPIAAANKMTFADLLRVSMVEDQQQKEKEQSMNNDTVSSAGVGVAVAGVTAAMAAASLMKQSESEPKPEETEETTDVNNNIASSTAHTLSPASGSSRVSREEAFAQRQRKKFSRLPTSGTQLYDIPESPKLVADEDPAGDALTYMRDDGDDLIEDMIGVSMIMRPKEEVDESPIARIAPEQRHSEDFGGIPVAAYPMADAFSSLYETEAVTPLDPSPNNSDSETEYAEVDGEAEYVRRKKWRVSPENAEKLSRVQTMSETIHPASRRSSYLPLTKTTSVPKSFNFKSEEGEDPQKKSLTPLAYPVRAHPTKHSETMAPIRNGKKRSIGGVNEVPKFNSNNNATNKINLNDYEEVEDEYGFRYMRKKQRILATTSNSTKTSASTMSEDDDEVLSTPVPKMVTLTAAKLPAASAVAARVNDAFSPSTPTPSKQILENNRKKRRSSFAAVQRNGTATGGGTATSTLQTQLPPENVRTAEYHRHIQTDLPGPVKMRQLMVWACQKAQGPNNLTAKVLDGLLSNDISTSWYQRPNNPTASNENVTYYLPNPQNQELSECIDLYKNYHQKLEKECEIWKELKAKPVKDCISSINTTLARVDNTLNVLFAEEFQGMSKWLHSLPLSIDRLDWNTKLALSFQDHAKQFCEGVFHQIFAKFFSADLNGNKHHQRIEPMMILRALSTNHS